MKKNVSQGGRPRAFDTHKALDQALLLFWQKGYEGTTIDDLCRTMGINRPSLYSAFKSKEALFRRVIDRYVEQFATVSGPISEPTSRRVAETLLRGTADAMGDPNPRKPRGCLVVHSALACGDEADPLRKELIKIRNGQLKALRGRFEKAKKDGDLPKDSDPTALARYLMTLGQGMAVQSVNGSTRSDLHRLVDVAMQAWPIAPAS